MKVYRNLLYILIFSTLIVGVLYWLGAINLQKPKGSVFVGAIIKQDDQLIPLFLKSIDQLDYDKKLISLQLNVFNTTPSIQQKVSDWATTNKNAYQAIKVIGNQNLLNENATMLEKNQVFASIKDGFLEKSKAEKCDYCFILSSNNFISPATLKTLIEKDKPIVAPLLRPVPESTSPFRNFFGAITESGYYKDSPDYLPIADRQKLGTFKVPCVHTVYLIQTPHVEKLSFSKNFIDWEFISFSKNARDNHVDQYICNEKEFGFFLHFNKNLSLEEEKSFSLIGSDLEITPAVFQSILAPHVAEDENLKKFADNFNLSDYTIFRIENKNLFYLDDVQDYIKTLFLKKGHNWEEAINEQFKLHAKPGTVAIDIGGHIGTHALNLSRIVGENGQVHVFEPQAKLFCELALNMHLNQCKNVVLHHKAAGGENKWIQTYIPKEAWTIHYSSDFINEGHGTVADLQQGELGDKARMIKLDDLNLNNVSFIKIDVEGYEMDVIVGAKETIKRNKPTMIIEIFYSADRDHKIKAIEALGYTHQPMGGADYLFVPSEA